MHILKSIFSNLIMVRAMDADSLARDDNSSATNVDKWVMPTEGWSYIAKPASVGLASEEAVLARAVRTRVQMATTSSSVMPHAWSADFRRYRFETSRLGPRPTILLASPGKAPTYCDRTFHDGFQLGPMVDPGVVWGRRPLP